MGCADRNFDMEIGREGLIASRDMRVGVWDNQAGKECCESTGMCLGCCDRMVENCDQDSRLNRLGAWVDFDCVVGRLKNHTDSMAAEKEVGTLLEELDRCSHCLRLTHDLRCCSRSRYSGSAMFISSRSTKSFPRFKRTDEP